MRLRLIPEEEVARRHAAARRPRFELSPAPPVKRLNERAVLDLGNLIFFTFQGRAYGVPPFGYKAGQLLTGLSLELETYRKGLTRQNQAAYFDLVARIAAQLWKFSRPVGRIARLLRRLRIHSNPYMKATEAELGELLHFFSSLRMRSSVQPLPTPSLNAGSIS